MTNSEIWAILDIRGLALHCYHSGVDNESDRKDIRSPEHTVFNFVERYLLQIVDTIPLNHIIAVHDSGSEYRKIRYPEYKANREEAEPAVHEAHKASFDAVKNLLHSLGIPQCYNPNTEADDVIAYLAKRLPGSKLIYTVDGDLTQLIDDDTAVFLKGDPVEGFTHKDIFVEPKHVALFKSLCGDSSDHIKGVKGFGPATWLKLCEQLGDEGLDQMVSAIEDQDLAKQWLDSLIETCPALKTVFADLEGWVLAYDLVKLHPEFVNKMMGNKKTCYRLSWVKRLPSEGNLLKLSQDIHARWLPEKVGHLLPQVRQLVRLPDWDDEVIPSLAGLFKQSRFVSLDWETWAPEHKPFKEAANGEYVDMLSSKICGTGFTCGQNHEFTFYFQWDHADEENNIPKQYLPEILKAVPTDMPVIAHNTIFERTVFLNEFDQEIPNLHDTKLMSGHVDEANSNSLKDLTLAWFRYNQTHYRDIIPEGKTMRDFSGEHVFEYGADDPWVTAHLYDLFKIILMTEGSWVFVREQEFTAMYPLSDAYIAGVDTDFAEVERQQKEDQATLDDCMTRMRALLEDNQTSDAIQAGADNWFQELVANKKGELEYLKKHIKALASRRSDFYQEICNDAVVKKAKLDKYINPSVTSAELVSVIELQESLLEEKFNVANRTTTPLWQNALDSATYLPFTVTETKARFAFTLATLNKLNQFLGLPTWTQENFTLDKLNQMIRNPELTSKQRHYADMVHSCLMSNGKHGKLEEYGYLKKLYESNFQGEPEKEGTELNLNSPKQMTELLYAILGLPIEVRNLDISKARKLHGLNGAPKTDKDAINHAIAYGHASGWKKEFLELLREAKSCMTRDSLFYSKFPLWKHPIDGLMHPQFNQIGTESRRPSGSNPNMLQLSKKGEGVKVRRSIIPNSKLGHDLIVTADWAAQELRVVAALSQDQNMLNCYVGEHLVDIHGFTAAFMLGVEYPEYISGLKGDDPVIAQKYKDNRGYAKNVNFGSIYGIGKAKLARQLLMPEEVSRKFLEAKKAAYPGVETWRDVMINQLELTGYFTTQFGSRRHLYEKLYDPDSDLVAYYKRAAINFMIQGCCADYLKKVLADLHRKQTYYRHDAVLVAPIYDELVNSINHRTAVPFILELYEVMTQGIPGLAIPMLAAPALGLNFADQIEILEDENQPLTAEKIEKAIELAFSGSKK